MCTASFFGMGTKGIKAPNGRTRTQQLCFGLSACLFGSAFWLSKFSQAPSMYFALATVRLLRVGRFITWNLDRLLYREFMLEFFDDSADAF